MDISREIKKHIEWIETVASFFRNEAITQEKLQIISQHDNCSLGQWMDSEESNIYQTLPEFEQLRENHKAFHQLARELIIAIEAENEAEAMTSYERFIELSQSVISHLNILQKKTVG